jgi:hypothetical protein
VIALATSEAFKNQYRPSLASSQYSIKASEIKKTKNAREAFFI